MVFIFATVSIIFACGIFLLLRRNALKVVIGIGLIGTAINLTIFVVNGWKLGSVSIMRPDEIVLNPAAIDPLPQALILTAIVIGFAMQAFLLILVRLHSQERGSMDPQDLEDGSR